MSNNSLSTNHGGAVVTNILNGSLGGWKGWAGVVTFRYATCSWNCTAFNVPMAESLFSTAEQKHTLPWPVAWITIKTSAAITTPTILTTNKMIAIMVKHHKLRHCRFHAFPLAKSEYLGRNWNILNVMYIFAEACDHFFYFTSINYHVIFWSI